MRMSRFVYAAAAVCITALCLGTSTAAHAAIPLMINHQGIVKVNTLPFTGQGLFKFGFYDDVTKLWLWTNNGSQVGLSITNVPTASVPISVANGIYNVTLGDPSNFQNMTAIPSSAFNGDKVFLRVYFNDGVNGEQVLSPDQPVSSAAYAFHAANADAVGGLDAGSIASQSSVDSLIAMSSDYANSINQNRINIMINSIASSSQPNTYSDGIVDVFTDASGFDDTIDTSATTASHSTNAYIVGGGTTTNPIESAVSSNEPQTKFHGYRFRMNVDTNFLTVVKEATCTATKVKILASNMNAYSSTESFSGDSHTFLGPFVAGTIYYAVVGTGGADYRRTNSDVGIFPVSGPGLDYIGGLGDDTVDHSDQGFNIADIQTGTAVDSGVVQSNALDIAPDPIAVQVVATNTVVGNASVDYDFKIGANAFQTGKALGQRIANTDAGSAITIRFNLTGNGAGNAVSISSYAIYLYY